MTIAIHAIGSNVRPPVTAQPALIATGIVKSFGAFRAVNDVSLTIAPNEIKAVIGPNGAGKSTLFSCIAGTLKPTAGTIQYEGRDITALPVHRRVKLGLVKSFQTTSIFPEMTVEDNVLMAVVAATSWSAADFVLTPWRRAETRDKVTGALRDVGLLQHRSAVASMLSHGDQRKLEIAIALACGANMLLLDEPTAGMGVDDIKGFIELAQQLRSHCGILLVEHNMSIVLGLSDRIVVLAQGAVLFEGTADEVRQDSRVRQAYLGRREV